METKKGLLTKPYMGLEGHSFLQKTILPRRRLENYERVDAE